ncbi:MAG: NADH-quinone oxidoreductase subunit NuoH [Pseudomonadota bacterium]
MSGIPLAVNFLLEHLQAWIAAHEASDPRLAHGAKIAYQALTSVPVEVLYVLLTLLAATVLILFFLAPLAGFSTYVERRVAARMQSRIGCNRVGPEGLLQFVADGLKLVLKEDTIPTGADRFLFRLAPYLVICGAFLSFVCIPFGPSLVVADLNVAILYLLAVSSLVVVGILLAGWSSNNKWSLLGAMRSAAQIVSYEIPMALALMVPVLLAGSLSLQDLNEAQAAGFGRWLAFDWRFFPAPLIAFFVYFIAALAEVNRTPFDLPEAESELVAGYSTEYSGIRWGLFFVAEYANMFLICAIAVTAFLGGWEPSKANVIFGAGALFFTLLFALKTATFLLRLLPRWVRGEKILDLISIVRPARMNRFMFVALGLISLVLASGLQFFAAFWPVALLFFVAKVYFFVFVIIWIRWTLPRIRIDQMMSLCWKKLVPLSFACVLWAAVTLWLNG